MSLERDIERLKGALGIPKDAKLTDDVISDAARSHVNESDRNTSPTADPRERSSLASGAISSNSDNPTPQALLETMVEATGQLSIDERGNCDYYANIAGLALIRRIRERCDALLEGSEKGQTSRPPESFKPLTSPVRSPIVSEETRQRDYLPPRYLAEQYVLAAFNFALPLVRFIHEPSFYARFDRFYAERTEMSSAASLDDIRFEALLNELFALGVMFMPSSQLEANVDSGAKA